MSSEVKSEPMYKGQSPFLNNQTTYKRIQTQWKGGSDEGRAFGVKILSLGD